MAVDADSTLPALSRTSRLLIRSIVRHGPQSRADLARQLGMSPASLTRLTAPLVADGLLKETGTPVQQRSGRPARPLDVMEDAPTFVGIKLTGEECFGVLTNLRGDVLQRGWSVLGDRTPAAAVDAIRQQLIQLGSDSRVAGLGVSLGGRVREHREVESAMYLGWEEVDLGGMLAEEYGVEAVIDNDVVALTKGMMWTGPYDADDRLAVITIGIGIGYGLIMHDQVVEGADSGLGLIGHLPLSFSGQRCSQGHQGCASALLTTRAISSTASIALQRPTSFEEAIDLAQRGQRAARMIVQEAAEALGRLIGIVANTTMTQRVVLTGEGLPLAQADPSALQRGLQAGRHPNASPVLVDLVPHDFALWARGAGVAAIQSWLDD